MQIFGQEAIIRNVESREKKKSALTLNKFDKRVPTHGKFISFFFLSFKLYHMVFVEMDLLTCDLSS